MKKLLLLSALFLAGTSLFAQENSCTRASQWLQSCKLCVPINWQPDLGSEPPRDCDLTICMTQIVNCPNHGDDGNSCIIGESPNCQKIRHLDRTLTFDQFCLTDLSACPQIYGGTCFIETSITISRGMEMITLSPLKSKIFIDKLRGASLDGTYDYLNDLNLGSWHYNCNGEYLGSFGTPVIMTGYHYNANAYVTIYNH